MDRVRLAGLYGVDVTYRPTADREVPVAEDTMVAVLAALGVDATTPYAVRDALAAYETARGPSLLPPVHGAARGPRHAGGRPRPAPGGHPADRGDRGGRRRWTGARRPRPGAATCCAPPPRTAGPPRRPGRRPRPAARPARTGLRLHGPALLHAVVAFLGHGRPRRPRRPRRLVGPRAGRRLRPDQPAARGRAGPAHRPVAVPPLLPPLPRPGVSADRGRSRSTPTSAAGPRGSAPRCWTRRRRRCGTTCCSRTR